MDYIHILFVITDSYLLYTCPLMKSIVINSSFQVNFHFICPYYTSQNKQLITDFANSLGCSLFFYTCNAEEFSSFYNTKRYPSFLYAKMIPHIYLPKNINRVLGLDVDTLVTGNIDSFYWIDFNSSILCACYNKRSSKNLLKSTLDEKYYQDGFNGGVILYNLDLFRKNNVTIDTYKKWINDYTLKTAKTQEQFEEWIMSNVFQNKCTLLMPFDYNYNISAISIYQEYCQINGIKPLKRIIHFQHPQNRKPWDCYEHFILGKSDNLIKYPFYEYYKQWWDLAKELPNEILDFYKNINNNG